MNLFKKIENDFLYPKLLRLHALAAQKQESHKYLDPTSQKMREKSTGIAMYQDFMCSIGSAVPKLQEIILKYRMDAVLTQKDTNNVSSIYNVHEIYETLSNLQTNEVEKIISYAKVKNYAVLGLLVDAVINKREEEFSDLLLKYECDLSQVNKALLYYDIFEFSPLQFAEGLDDVLGDNFIDTYIKAIADQICELSNIDKNEILKFTYREYLFRLKDWLKEVNELIDKPIEGTREAMANSLLSIMNEIFPPLIDIQYEYYVKWFLGIEEILSQKEKEIYLDFVRTPEYEEKYDSIERGYHNLPEDCPFINIKPKQLAAIIEILKEKATHKAGNKAKNKEFCRGDVLDAIVALKLLGVFVVPKNDNNGLKDLTRWLDDNIPHSDLSKPENQYRVNVYLRDGENECKDAVKKDIEVFRDLGIG